MNTEDEFPIPITTEPEELFDDLREQTEVIRLAEGLLRYTDPSFAPGEEREMDDPSSAAA